MSRKSARKGDLWDERMASRPLDTEPHTGATKLQSVDAPRPGSVVHKAQGDRRVFYTINSILCIRARQMHEGSKDNGVDS